MTYNELTAVNSQILYPLKTFILNSILHLALSTTGPKGFLKENTSIRNLPQSGCDLSSFAAH
jgi:hypothetical protein